MLRYSHLPLRVLATNDNDTSCGKPSTGISADIEISMSHGSNHNLLPRRGKTKSITSSSMSSSSSSNPRVSTPRAADGERRGNPIAPSTHRPGHTRSGAAFLATDTNHAFAMLANVKSSLLFLRLPTMPIVTSMLVFAVT